MSDPERNCNHAELRSKLNVKGVGMSENEISILMLESATRSQRGAVARCERRLAEAAYELQRQRNILQRMDAELGQMRQEWLSPIEGVS